MNRPFTCSASGVRSIAAVLMLSAIALGVCRAADYTEPDATNDFGTKLRGDTVTAKVNPPGTVLTGKNVTAGGFVWTGGPQSFTGTIPQDAPSAHEGFFTKTWTVSGSVQSPQRDLTWDMKSKAKVKPDVAITSQEGISLEQGETVTLTGKTTPYGEPVVWTIYPDEYLSIESQAGPSAKIKWKKIPAVTERPVDFTEAFVTLADANDRSVFDTYKLTITPFRRFYSPAETIAVPPIIGFYKFDTESGKKQDGFFGAVGTAYVKGTNSDRCLGRSTYEYRFHMEGYVSAFATRLFPFISSAKAGAVYYGKVNQAFELPKTSAIADAGASGVGLSVAVPGLGSVSVALGGRSSDSNKFATEGHIDGAGEQAHVAGVLIYATKDLALAGGAEKETSGPFSIAGSGGYVYGLHEAELISNSITIKPRIPAD